MDKSKINTSELREKILKGIDLAFEKLIRTKQKEDRELVFSKDGQVIRIKANDMAKR